MKSILFALLLISASTSAQTQKAIDSAQWAYMRQMIVQQKTNDSIQWAYMSLMVHKLLPQYATRFAFDSLCNQLKVNMPWGLLPDSISTVVNPLLFYNDIPKGDTFPCQVRKYTKDQYHGPALKDTNTFISQYQHQFCHVDTCMDCIYMCEGCTKYLPKPPSKSFKDVGPYLLAWDSRSQGYRIAYVDENKDEVEWLELNFGEYHFSTGRKTSDLFKTKKAAVEAIHRHWKQVKDSRNTPIQYGHLSL